MGFQVVVINVESKRTDICTQIIIRPESDTQIIYGPESDANIICGPHSHNMKSRHMGFCFNNKIVSF